MISPKASRSKPLSVSKSRWAAYAAAGAASSLTGISSAEADIHYSGPVNLVIPVAESVNHAFNLDNNAVIRFENFATRYSSPGYGVAAFRLQGASISNVFAGAAIGNFRYPSNVPNDADITARPFQAFNGNFFATLAYGAGFANSKFKDPGVAFIGFRFNGGAGMEYGWVRVNMQGGPGNAFTVVDYAWADAGTAIKAGQTAAAVPEPGSLGLLALGGAGLVAWRKRRAQAAAK